MAPITPAQADAQAAEAVRLISQLGSAVLNAVDEGIYCLDAQGCTTFVNEAATRMLGYTFREMVGKPQHALIHHHYVDGSPFPAEACPIWSSVSDGVHQRVGGDIFWRKDGTPLPVDYTSIPIREGRKVVAVVVTFRDVSVAQQARAQAERLAAERAAREAAERGQAALIEAEERFRLALEAGRMGMWEWDIVGEQVIWSPQEERIYGIPEGSFSGTLEEYRERIHPDDRDEALGKVQEALAARASTHHILHRIIRPDGELRWIDSHGRFIYAPDGTPRRLTGVSTDVTESHLAAERLRHRDERFQALIAATGQIIWTNSPDGNMRGEQPSWAAFTGQTRAQYQGFGWADAVHPDDAQPTIAAWNEAVRNRTMFVFEHRVRRHDGVYLNFAIRAVPILGPDGAILEWVGGHTDITEQHAARAEIERQRLEAQKARADLLRVFEQAPAAIATTEGPTHVFRTANPLFRRLLGNRELVGKPVREAVPELDGQPFFGILDEVYARGEAHVGNAVRAVFDRTGTGKLEEGIFDYVYQPLRAGDGAVAGIMIHAVELKSEAHPAGVP
ncbi:MAG: hypothetical protein NVS1B4_06800 [Gemmatimonadaceae bacterium]